LHFKFFRQEAMNFSNNCFTQFLNEACVKCFNIQGRDFVFVPRRNKSQLISYQAVFQFKQARAYFELKFSGFMA